MKSKKLIVIICLLTLSNTYLLHNKKECENEIKVQQKQIVDYKSKNTKLEKQLKNIKLDNNKKDKEINELKSINKNLKTNNEKLKKDNLSRGGGLSNLGNSKQIKIHITFFTNLDNKLQGGQFDKKGKRLTSHDMNVCAMPSDVTYGSILNVEGMGKYKVVDTGNAIQWLNEDKTECKVDVFIPNVSEEWIINNTENKVVNATLYYK